MRTFEVLEKRELLAVVVSIANTETVQVTDADVVDILDPPVSGELSPDPVTNQLRYVWYGDDPDTFSYSPGTDEVVDVWLYPANDPPVGVRDTYVTHANARMNVKAVDGVLANDIVAESDALVDLVVNVFPAHGRLKMGDDGGFSYKPDKHYVGMDSFSYTVSSEGSSPSRSNPVNVRLFVNDNADAYDYYFAQVVNQINANRKASTNVLPLYGDYYAWQR